MEGTDEIERIVHTYISPLFQINNRNRDDVALLHHHEHMVDGVTVLYHHHCSVGTQ